jgi:hypothetical protein
VHGVVSVVEENSRAACDAKSIRSLPGEAAANAFRRNPEGLDLAIPLS